MAPKFKAGDIVTACPYESPKNGDFVVAGIGATMAYNYIRRIFFLASGRAAFTTIGPSSCATSMIVPKADHIQFLYPIIHVEHLEAIA
jgi:hypothetical protein